LDEAIAKELTDTSIDFESDAQKVSEANVVIICVPTPVYEDHTPNLEPLLSAAVGISIYLKKEALS